MTFQDWQAHKVNDEKLSRIKTRLPALKREAARLEADALALEDAGVVPAGTQNDVAEAKARLGNAEQKVQS